MKFFRRAALAALALAASTLWAADPGVTFIGRGAISAAAADKSGLTGKICQKDDPTNCIARNLLGGFGSGLTYTGFDNVYVATPDRGPFDGRTDVPYLDRFHFFHITVDTSVLPNTGNMNITPKLLDTRFLKSEANHNFVGDSYAFNTTNPLQTLRFDPEGVVVSREGTLFISDEYGPYINEFNRDGHLIRRIPVPAKFLIANPSGDVDSAGNSVEIYPANNTSGRQANRGMEGLAISPDGRYLVGIIQNALIQDNGLDSNTPPGRMGLNNRILKYDLLTGQTQEFVYTVEGRTSNPPTVPPLLPGQGRGVNEMLAINDHQFLVLERDNRTNLAGTSPNLKSINKIELNGATDVSNVASLPQSGGELAGAGITAVTKTVIVNMLDSSYKVDINSNPQKTIKDVVAEKLEGMAWGPDLPDGKHVLYVMSDNDLLPGIDTQIYAFAIDASATRSALDFQRQDLPGPLFPPGQVKKALSEK